ncbi:class I SAM-dependent methyltransferase [Streptomyces sp. ODS28]|uniref:O-methyltransferase n=1 Tax=Streptomyces sp. ODS28 TaxID=3136688 RepID=UPI0031EBF0D4
MSTANPSAHDGAAYPPLLEPPAVITALEQAHGAGFAQSCTPEVGRLLAALALSKPGGRIAESGTGFGVGTAWLRSGLHGGAELLTVERDPGRADGAAELFRADPQLTVLTGDWTLLRRHAPYDLFFCDGGGKREDPDGVVDLLAPGGVLILDDFSPSHQWPPLFNGAPDELRIAYLTHPSLHAAEVQVAPAASVIIATRR